MSKAGHSGWYNGTCPACGRDDWCRQSDTGAYICRRGPGEGTEERKDKHRVPYWIYLPEGVQYKDLRPTAPKVKRAYPHDLHLVYGTLLQRLALSDRHREEWERRGVSAAIVERHRVRTWPGSIEDRGRLARELYREFGDVCRRVPGWYVRDGRPMLAGGAGWIIPMWDLSGYVVAMRIRSDQHDPTNPRSSKYYWLSSAGPDRGGTSPGTHARVAWPGRSPRPDDRAEVVRVTEGEAKSIVLAEHTGVPTISLPGVTMWTTALPWLRWLRARKVLLCFDSDRKKNPKVAHAYLAAVRGYQSHGYTVATETWGIRNYAK